MNYLIIGDPSGLHCLNLIERGVLPQNITVWEDTTKGINSCLNRGVIVVSDLDELMGQRFSVVIGNPPYGSGGNLAIKFLNKCAELSDDIRMVLPLSFKKVSVQNKVRLDLIIADERELPLDTFPNGIRAVYQRWVKTDAVREKVKTFTTHPDFEFVSKNEADCMLFRCGASTGKIKLRGEFDENKPDHYYMKATPQVIQNIVNIQDQLIAISNFTNGMPGISKHEFITCYIENYGRSKVILPRTHEDFEFLRYEDRFDANVFIGEYGCGPSGRVKTENFTHYAKGHYFIKAKDQSVIDKLVSLESLFRAKASGCNGRFHISKGELIEIYTKN